ncbi:MAG TPA: Na+/H+ antiporter NhaA [Acidimicrobiales bacterium]|jgi:NhaA family Na+:H+ antiporter|nr:Na+/H+ antiporter NhaA [Acidimicrobiales bacterium]
MDHEDHDLDRPDTAGPLLMAAAAVAALLWANSPWSGAYASAADRLHDPVNQGLMTLFFFVVGAEIRREMAGWRDVALPAAAAVGGMVVPALLYTAIAGGRGWGIPMATDIAFALAVLSVAVPKAPPALRLFLLTLAVVDDVGALLVIALFSGGPVHWLPLAGTAVALALPARPARRLERVFTPVTVRLVLPLFALVNAGVELHARALTEPVAIAVVVGLVVGKPLGITAAVYGLTRTGLASLPPELTMRHITTVGLAAGVGFTVSLFMAQLAFADPSVATTAVLAASTAAAAVTVAWGRV